MSLVCNGAVSSGTATARAYVNGASTAFNGGSVQLNTTDTTSDSDRVAHASGVAVTAGQTVGCAILSASLSPTSD